MTTPGPAFEVLSVWLKSRVAAIAAVRLCSIRAMRIDMPGQYAISGRVASLLIDYGVAEEISVPLPVHVRGNGHGAAIRLIHPIRPWVHDAAAEVQF